MSFGRYLVICSILISTLCAASVNDPEVTLRRTLHRRVENYSLRAENLLQGLAKFSDDFEIPIGIEWQVSSVPYRSVELQFARSTVIDILTDLVATEPGYTFNISNGVVHVSRVTIADDRRNFLNLQIDDFQLSDEYVFHANNRLRNLVVQLVNPAPEKTGTACAGSFGVGAGDRVVSFHLSNVTARDILDRFITSAGFNIWLVAFPELPELTSRGFFESISVFSPNLPESELPAWDLFLPGYDPVKKEMGIGWKQGAWRTRPEDSAPANAVPHEPN